MSSNGIQCPRCGAQCRLKAGTKSDYYCAECNTAFRLLASADEIVTSETLARNCQSCGRPIKAGEGFACMQCRKTSLCSNCMQQVAGKFFCKECIREKGLVVGPLRICPKCCGQLTYVPENNRWYCYNCKIYVTHLCPKCGGTATYVKEYERWYCDTCKSYLTYTCPKCGGQLTYIPEYQKWYCYQCRKYA